MAIKHLLVSDYSKYEMHKTHVYLHEVTVRFIQTQPVTEPSQIHYLHR
jgi:hypothetical protein